MIISHKYKFIFIHCRKVAGSSIKVTLAPLLGPDDIIIGSLNEILAAGSGPTRAMQRILWQPSSLFSILKLRRKGHSWANSKNVALKKHFEQWLGPNPPHPSAAEARQFLGPVWTEYFKFCFARNPYERIASDYFWRRKATSHQFSFHEYLELLDQRLNRNKIIHRGGVSNWEMMTIDNNLVVDFVGKYENINEDFELATIRIGLGPLHLNVRAKSSGATSRYANLYGKVERDLVERIFAAELNTFGYTFPY